MSEKEVADLVSPAPKRALPVFRIPLLLAAVTVVGLVAGLLGDGLPDVLAWLGLGLPVLACAYKCA